MHLHHVDPNKKRGLVYRANMRFGGSRLGRAYGLRVGSKIDPGLFRATGGRYPWILGAMATAPLMTSGARSGKSREVQVMYFHDGRDPIVVASNGGGARHPGWYYNLKAQPECELGDERFRAVEVTGESERARLFAEAELVFAGYADYREKTAAFGREIPIFRLEPR